MAGINYKTYFRNDGHGIMVIRLILPVEATLTEEELKRLEVMAIQDGKAFAFHNNRLACEVEYIPQN